MGIRELREITGMSQTKFGEKYGIPMRTIQNWETGQRECPEYVARLLERAVKEDYDMEAKAIEKVMAGLGLDESLRSEVTLNTCRNGRKVAWYLDETKEMCVYIDTLEELTEEEIEKELA